MTKIQEFGACSLLMSAGIITDTTCQERLKDREQEHKTQ